MKTKRIISLLAAAAMAVTALTGAMSVSAISDISAADGLATSGSWGTDGKWVLSQDGTLLVTGTGEINSKTNVTPICKLGQEVKRLVIGEGITQINTGYLVSDLDTLTEMVLPSTFSGDVLGNCQIRNDTHKPLLKDVYIYSKDITVPKNNSGCIPEPGSGVVMHLYKDSETEKCFRSLFEYTDEDIVYIEGDRPADPVLTPANVEPLTETSGPSGLNSKWEYNTSNNTLTFSGEGVISIGGDYKKYAKTTEHIVIGEGITQIKANTGQVRDNTCIVSQAFYGFTAVKDVKIPNTLKVIGEASFYQTPITKIDLPSSLETIERNAFKYSNLEEISFPESLKEIGEAAFAYSKLKSINLHEGMSIGGSAFGSCESLKEVTIPKNVFFERTAGGGQGMAREHETFSGCTGLESITIEDGSVIVDSWRHVQTENGIGSNFCINCTSLKTVIIKGDVDCVMMMAFGGCTSLKDIYFYNTGLTTITAKNSPGDANADPKNPSGWNDSIWTGNNPTFHVVKGSTTEQTLKDAGYLNDENTVYIADTTALETAISEAEDIDTSKYTDESVSEFTKAIESAKAVLENLDATQDEVDSAVKAIEDAKKALADKSGEPSTDNSSDPSNSSDKNNQSQSPNTPATPSTSAPTTATPKPIIPPTVTTTAAKPAKVKNVKVTAKKKKLNVSWKKVSGATGYEVMSATNNKFTKNKKTVTVKKNKVILKKLKPKKKYFVKVRAYKLASGRKYFGKWSKVVKKKVK